MPYYKINVVNCDRIIAFILSLFIWGGGGGGGGGGITSRQYMFLVSYLVQQGMVRWSNGAG